MYRFDKTHHIHTLDGQPLMGVTTVLGVISKPFLVQWSANMACDYIRENANSHFIDGEFNHYESTEEILDKAKVAHRVKRDKAGNWGTEVHEAIENWIKQGIEPKFEGTQKQVFDNFKNWATENKVEFLESEKHIWSKELWIGGIVDLVFTMDGKKYIGDIKTGSGIYNEAFFQMGAYHLCLEEMGEAKDVEGYLVINLKKDGKMDMKMAVDIELNQTAFKHALGLYKIINSLT